MDNVYPFYYFNYLFFWKKISLFSYYSGGSWNEVQVMSCLLLLPSPSNQRYLFWTPPWMARLSLNPIGLHRFQPCLHLQPSQKFTLYPPRHRRIRFLTLASQTDPNHNEKDNITSTTPVKKKKHFHYYYYYYLLL